MSSSIKNGLFTAIVVGASATAAHASADLGEAKVIQADEKGFEATVALMNQPIGEITSVDLTRNPSAPNANMVASKELRVSLDQSIDATEKNHLIRVKGPGEVSLENLAFNVQVSKTDGTKLIKSFEVVSGVLAGVPMNSPMLANVDSLSNNVAVSPEVAAVMAEFEEVPGVTVLSEQAVTVPVIKVSEPKSAQLVATAEQPIRIGEIKAQSSMGERLMLEFDIAGGDNIGGFDVQVVPDTSLGALAPDSVTAIAMMDQKIEKRSNGNYVVRLTSDQVMNEPLIPLLVDVKAGGQTESRRYSVFMDPPKAGLPTHDVATTFTAQNGDFILVDTPAKKATRTKVASRTPATSLQKGEATARVYAKATERYTVSEGDTLATIATNLKGKLPLSEKMKQLKDLNPNAFVNGDVNKVITGVVLKVPADWKRVSTVKAATPAPVLEEVSPVEALAATETVVAKNQTPAVDAEGIEVLAQGQATIANLDIPNMSPELDQLIGDEAIVVEPTGNTSVQVAPVAKVETAPVATAVVEDSGSLLDNTNAIALAGGVAATAMIAGGVVLLRRRKSSSSEFSSEDGDYELSDLGDISEYMLQNDDVSLDRIEYLSEANALVARGQIDQALVILQTGMKEEPKNTNVLYKLFELFALKDDFVSFNSTAALHAELLRQDKQFLERVNLLAQDMTTVPDLFLNLASENVDGDMVQGQAAV